MLLPRLPAYQVFDRLLPRFFYSVGYLAPAGKGMLSRTSHLQLIKYRSRRTNFRHSRQILNIAIMFHERSNWLSPCKLRLFKTIGSFSCGPDSQPRPRTYREIHGLSSQPHQPTTTLQKPALKAVPRATGKIISQNRSLVAAKRSIGPSIRKKSM